MPSLNYISNFTPSNTINQNVDTVTYGTTGGSRVIYTEQERNLLMLLKLMYKFLAETSPLTTETKKP
jgi:hypothetical protein